MEILDTAENKRSPQITIPKECIDPKDYKPGDKFEYTVKGTVKSSDDDYGVRVELSHGDEDEDMEDDDDLEDMPQKKREKKFKDEFEKSSKALEEYR